MTAIRSRDLWVIDPDDDDPVAGLITDTDPRGGMTVVAVAVLINVTVWTIVAAILIRWLT